MYPEIIAIFIPIVAIIGGITMIIYLRKYENQERMAMIDKGMSPFDERKVKSNPNKSLRFSLLMIGIGLGFVVGYFLDANTNMRELSYFAMLFIWGGVGLGLSYLIEEKKAKEQHS